MEAGEVIFPQQCKEEQIPTDIKTDESSNSNTPERHLIHPYLQDCTEEYIRTTQDYQMEPGEVIFPQQCKEEQIPTDIKTDGSSNRNTPERRPIHPYSQDCTEEDYRTTQDYQMEPGDGMFPQQWKEEEIPAPISRGET
ncbi:uncharacterized protein WCC33_001314 [Rhinophrynus dorsalis]